MGYRSRAGALVVGIEDAPHDTGRSRSSIRNLPQMLSQKVRAHLDRQFCHILAPYTVRVRGFHFEYIIAMTDTVEADDIAASVRYPLAWSCITIYAMRYLV